MSKLDKLMIMGVRSFDNKHGETIVFFSPLTLVVGTNGSGKTTIIECLKYATTGILPPNCKVGGAFIHDPNLVGEKEVMAQVKLQFKASTGSKMVATRSLSLTVKKNSRTQKTLDGTLLTANHGEKTTVSSRVAQLDTMLPQYLGVSTAVLDNVIFCHQDDSLWPMSDSSTLKKKFDEIFEAQKYTKAIDELKKIRKKHNDELKLYKEKEQFAKQDRDRCRKAETKAHQLQADLEDLREKANDLGQRMDRARKQAEKAWEDSEGYAEILGALEGKRDKASTRQSVIKDLRTHLKEVSESDEWLEETLSDFNTTLAKYEEDRSSKREQWLRYKDEMKGLQDQMAIKLAEKGKHEQEKEEHDRQLERRKEMVKNAASKHQIRGYDDPSNDTMIEDFFFKIKKVSKDLNHALDRSRRDGDIEKRESQTLINRLTERKAALQDSKISAKRQLALNDREVSDLQKRVNQIDVDEGSKAVCDARIDDLNTKMQRTREVSQAADRDGKLKKSNDLLRLHEMEAAELNAALIQGTKRAGEVARLAHLKQELKERERSLQTLLDAHSERLKTLIGDQWTDSSIEEVYQSCLGDVTNSVSVAESNRDRIAREIEQVQFKQKSLKADLDHKTNQANQYEATVCQAINGPIDEYDEALRNAQTQVDTARDVAKGLGGLSDYFTKVLDVAENRHACRTCERAFRSANDPALTKFKQKIEGLIKRASTQSLDADLAKAVAEHKRILEAGVTLESWKNLSTEEIPGIEKESKRLTQQRDALLVQIESHDKIVEDRQSSRRDIEAISRIVSSITECYGDVKKLTTQISEVSDRQSQQGNVKTLEEIQNGLQTANEEIAKVKKIIFQLTSEQDIAKSEMHAMELQLKDLHNDLNTAVSQLEKKASLFARAEDFKSQNQRQREAIDKTDRDIGKLEPEISTAEAKYEDAVQRWDDKVRKLTQDSSAMSETINALEMLNNQIRAYVERQGPTRLPGTIRDIDNIQSNLGRVELAQTQLTKEISKVEDNLRDSENTKRQYADNLRFRQETRNLQQLQIEIAELESHNAHIDRTRLQEEGKRRQDEHHKLSGQREGIIGEAKSKDVQLGELLAEYETDLKDAPARYKEAHIKVETTKAVIEDLGRYGGALDRAVMKFHQLKMDEVNSIIDELWKKTYQGIDVDTIIIKSDHEAKTTARTYNYRVVMIKQDTEMDMRGRCSAGQKVLASIIIRLALAECFSVNCGLIALDEPTTNLDRDNIQALARSLHDIIQMRQQQSNFQLIVITHDEEFLHHMQCGDFADYYYRVSRDRKMNSIIQKQHIDEVM